MLARRCLITAPQHNALLMCFHQQLIQVKAADVEALLGRLSDINDAMSGAISGANDARTHTLARHRDILHDFNQVCVLVVVNTTIHSIRKNTYISTHRSFGG